MTSLDFTNTPRSTLLTRVTKGMRDKGVSDNSIYTTLNELQICCNPPNLPLSSSQAPSSQTSLQTPSPGFGNNAFPLATSPTLTATQG